MAITGRQRKNISGMSKQVLMDQTLQNMRGHLTIAQILIILVSLTKALFALEKPWRLGTPLLPGMLTIILSRFQTSHSILFKQQSPNLQIYTLLLFFLLFLFRLFLDIFYHFAFHFYPLKADSQELRHVTFLKFFSQRTFLSFEIFWN